MIPTPPPGINNRIISVLQRQIKRNKDVEALSSFLFYFSVLFSLFSFMIFNSSCLTFKVGLCSTSSEAQTRREWASCCALVPRPTSSCVTEVGTVYEASPCRDYNAAIFRYLKANPTQEKSPKAAGNSTYKTLSLHECQ